MILGSTIRDLRSRRLAGASVDELYMRLLQQGGDPHLAIAYLHCAFYVARNALYVTLLPNPMTGGRHPAESIERALGRRMDETKARWSQTPFPELMRLRDYFAFFQLAQAHAARIFVSAPSPGSRAVVGHPRFRCHDGSFLAFVRSKPPYIGALALDPDDFAARLGLNEEDRGNAYDAYVRSLSHRGYKVLEKEHGFLVLDPNDRMLHEPYRLFGIYRADAKRTIWSPALAHSLLRDLNRLLGSQLAVTGPHSHWEHRSELSPAAIAFPMLMFGPDHQLETFMNEQELIAADVL